MTTESTNEKARKKEIEEAVEQIIKNEVLYNQSRVVEYLRREEDFEDWEMCVHNLYADPDQWDAKKCDEWMTDHGIAPYGYPTTTSQLRNWMRVNGITHYYGGVEIDIDTEDAENLWDELFTRIEEGITEWEIDEIRELIRDSDYAYNKPLEWWLVTDWAARKLIDIGEVVYEDLGCHWWGRTSSDRRMESDGALQLVAAKIVDEWRIAI